MYASIHTDNSYPRLAGSLQIEGSLIPDVGTVSKTEQTLLIGIQHCKEGLLA